METWEIVIDTELSEYFDNNDGMVVFHDHFNEWEHGRGVVSFVCHESHEETVLAMLKGAKGQCRLIGSNQAWSDCNLGIKGEWSADFWYTSDKFESRIVATV